MGDFEVIQRTKDGYFEANSLLSQWNNVKDNPRRDMNKYLSSSKTIEFINVIKSKSQKSELADYQVEIKKKGKAMKNGGRSRDEIYMHPYLFIDFSMWINPSFKYDVLKFVYDELIKQRHDAGDNYISLSASGQKLKGYDYREVAIALQWIVFGKKGKELRQSATQDQLKELNDLQTKLSFAIDMGYITSYQQLISELRKLYSNKNLKF